MITLLSKRPLLPVVFVVILLFLVTVIWRVNAYAPNNDVVNIDATYHTLLTMKSLDQGDMREHLFLPLVSLSENGAEKYIQWGDTVPDDNGNYYYTSFPQLGFVVPLFLLKIFSAEISVINLMFVNFFFESVTIILLMILTYRIFRDTRSDSTVAAAIFTGLIAVIYMFSLEVFYSQGIIYWAQSLMQPILIGEILVIYMMVSVKKFKPYLAGILGMLVFAGILTEWTGYVSAAAIIAYLVYRAIKLNMLSYVIYSAIATGSALVGVLAYLVPFIINTQFSEFIAISARRFTARHTPENFSPTLEQLGLSYLESFGPFIIAIMVCVAMLYINKTSWAVFRTTARRYMYLLLLAALPLIENIIMRQHAYQYNFDRLKLFIPLAIIAVIIYTSAHSKMMRTAVACTLLLSVVVSAVQISLSSRLVAYLDFSKTASTIAEVKREYPNASFSFNGPVRGWLNLHVGTNIHENVTDYQKFRKDCTRKTCVWLVGTLRGTAQYNIYGAYVFNAETQDVKVIGEPRCNYCNNAPTI